MTVSNFNRLCRSAATIACCLLFAAGCVVERNGTANLASPSAKQVQLPVATQSGDDTLQIVESLPAPENTRGGADSVLLVGDLIEVDVFQVDELDKEVQIDSSGRISLPLIGQINAAGKTAATLERDLERKYGIKHLQSPDITVLVKESLGQKVTLNGEFLAPGIYPTDNNTTLLQAVAQGRGLSPIADPQKIFVYRDFKGKKLVANYNLKNIQQGKASNPRIYGGDIIVSFSSSSKVAFNNLKSSLGVAANAVRAIPLL